MPPRFTALSFAFSLRITAPPLTPRIAASLPSLPSCIQFFSTTPALDVEIRRRNLDPSAIERIRLRRIANINLQQELAAQRARDAADPVWGKPTAFVESLDKNDLPLVDMTKAQDIRGPKAERLNYFLSQQEVAASLENSRKLLSPSSGSQDPSKASFSGDVDLKELEAKHLHTIEVIRRITSLANGSAADKARSNIQQCIEIFGRHVTDSKLPPDPNVAPAVNKTPRAGPDTGSSEVQAAILTIKIRKLARVLEKEGRKDMHNKRNLRVLVHKRQKMLRYLKRKEKGGIRYRNIMEALGLDDNAIEQEIFM